MERRFQDRRAAGRALAAELVPYVGEDDVVLALPRGGVPVAFEIAEWLGVPLDVFVVRKLVVPGHEELTLGAIASGDVECLNDHVIARLGVSRAVIDDIIARETPELHRRERLYRGDRPPPSLIDRTALLIDDGIVTGATMRAAIAALRHLEPRRLVVAAPVATHEGYVAVGAEVDDIVCVATPRPFVDLPHWYDDFSEVTDTEVSRLLAAANAHRPRG